MIALTLTRLTIALTLVSMICVTTPTHAIYSYDEYKSKYCSHKDPLGEELKCEISEFTVSVTCTFS